MGGAGDDTLAGSSGVDDLCGSDGNDTYNVDQADTVTELSGEGVDHVRMTSTVAGLTFHINTAYTNVEKFTLLGALAGNVTGNNDDNVLTGNSAANTLIGGLGNDTLVGGAGNDVLDGGAGDDQIMGGEGNDIINGGVGFDGVNSDNDMIDGGAGFDTVTYADALSDIVVMLDKNDAQTDGGAGIDLLIGIECVIGGAGNDHIRGGSLSVSLTFEGGSGDDFLEGGIRNDTLMGGVGNDTLWGSAGIDNMSGGSGADHFRYTETSEGGAGETIIDFEKGSEGDILDLSDLLDSVGYAGSDAIADGFVRFVASGADTIVDVDTSGGGDSFQRLVLLKNVALSSTDTENYAL